MAGGTEAPSVYLSLQGQPTQFYTPICKEGVNKLKTPGKSVSNKL